jgi:rubredoxin
MSDEVLNWYDCDVCGYRYRPSDHGGVEFDAQPPDFECPTCQSNKDHFHLFTPPSDDIAPAPRGEVDDTDEVDPTGARVMYTNESSPTLMSLHIQWQRGRLNTQPDFQRYEVWSAQKKSALIESILLDLPIPQVFLAQEADNTTVAVDGQQRLTAIFRYMSDEYPLIGVVSTINSKYFKDLTPELQEKIETYELRVVRILKESDPEVRFLLFQRLNEGSVSLNDQELRNSVWRGPYNDFLKKLADDPGWRDLLNLKKRHPRMVDVELALRYSAFRDQSYMAHPDKKTGKFLDKQMMLGRGYKDKDYAAAERDLKTAVLVAQYIYGKRACRRYISGTEQSPNGKWDGRLNRALMDVQLWGFNRHPSELFLDHADAIREASIELLCDPEFTDLTTHTISEFRRLERRFDMWKQMLDGVLEGRIRENLVIGDEKKTVFDANATCAACATPIDSIDDARVVSSTDRRRRLAAYHRYCFREKG